MKFGKKKNNFCFLNKLFFRIFPCLFFVIIFFSLFTAKPIQAETTFVKRNKYLNMVKISGVMDDLELKINEKSLNLDLSRSRNIRLRINPKDLYNEIDRTTSIKLTLYEIYNGERKYISTQNLTIYKGFKRSRIISMDVGFFNANKKNIEVDVFDTSSNIINTYSAEINAINTDSQVLGGSGINVGKADCDVSDGFDECELDYLFQRVTFEAKPQAQISTRIVKGEDGLYKVTIPVPRTKFKFLGRNIQNNQGGNGGIVTNEFGETISSSVLQIGDSIEAMGTITYSNNIAEQLVINNKFFLNLDGKLGVGLNDPKAWVHIIGGDSSTPSLILNQGILTTNPINGAIEFDGNGLYFTKNGVRSALGAQGPSGPVGPQGPAGPQGPPGSSGNLNGSTLDDITLTGMITINGVTSFIGQGRIEGNLNVNGNLFADEYHARLFNGQVFNGGIFNGTFLGSGAGIRNLNIDGYSVNNLTLKGTTIINGASLFI
ncbi:MAG: hypothetical protein RLZZ361_273, partial [Cyanobacteriota bacterium]